MKTLSLLVCLLFSTLTFGALSQKQVGSFNGLSGNVVLPVVEVLVVDHTFTANHVTSDVIASALTIPADARVIAMGLFTSDANPSAVISMGVGTVDHPAIIQPSGFGFGDMMLVLNRKYATAKVVNFTFTGDSIGIEDETVTLVVQYLQE